MDNNNNITFEDMKEMSDDFNKYLRAFQEFLIEKLGVNLLNIEDMEFHVKRICWNEIDLTFKAVISTDEDS